MDTPQSTDGRLHETEIWPYPRVTYPFRDRAVPDVLTRQYARKYFIDPPKYSPKLGRRTVGMNLVAHSNKFSSGWTLNNVTVVPNAIANPWDGALTVDFVKETATTADFSVTSAFFNFPSSGTYIAWAIVKASGRDYAYMFLPVTGAACYFNLTTLTVGSSVGCTGIAPVSLGGGLFRIAMTKTVPGPTPDEIVVGMSAADNVPVYAGNTANGLYIAQVQVERGSTPGVMLITTTTGSTASAPDTDPVDASAFLVSESDLDHTGANAAEVTRIFSRIPNDQVSYEKRAFSRPSGHGFRGATYWGVSFDDNETTSLFNAAARKSISAIAAPDVPSTTVLTTEVSSVPVGTVTFTLTGGSSFSFLTSASAASIQSTVFTNLGTCAVVRSDVDITIEGPGVVSSCKTIEISGTGLELSAQDTTVKIDMGGSGANATSTRSFTTSAAHGGAAGNKVAFFKGTKIVALSQAITAAGSTFTVSLDDVAGANFSADTVVFSSAASYRFVNGAKDCDIRITERYFLPGVTAGITSGADYPTTTFYIDAIGWMLAIEAYLSAPPTFAAIAAKQGQYIGPILVNTIEEVEMADALESRNVDY